LFYKFNAKEEFMNKSLLIIFCLVSIFLFAETDIDKENLKGSVSTFFPYKYQPDLDSETLNWELNYSPYGEKKKYFTEQGMLIKEEIFAEDGNMYGGSSYGYDNMNNLILITDYDHSNEIDRIYKYTFDEKGNVLVEYCSNADSVFFSIYEFFYDENGNKISSECHDSLDNCTEAFTYKFDERGNITEQTVINYDWIQDRTVYSYDSNDRMVENRIYDVDDVLIEITSIEYNENDDYASIFKHKLETDEISEYKFKYNEDNKMTEAMIYKNDILFKTDLYEYNEQGDDSSIVLKFTDRTESYTYEYVYDEKGNWIEKIEYLNGVASIKYIQEISYFD
jgi:hypothetical protein